jgi:N-acetylglucosamine-6-sulfatase
MAARRVRGLLVAAALSAACTTVGVRAGPSLAPETAAAQGERPNIVVVMTDDQRAGDVEEMPLTQALLAESGTTFANSYVNFPLCCPARATFMTGQYAHNHGILDNTPPAGGYAKFDAEHGDDNLATWLQDAGYTNGYVGKFMPGYGNPTPTSVPDGWDDWHAGLPEGQEVYGYSLYENGAVVSYGNDADDFKQDVTTDKAVDFIEASAPAGEPFFLGVGYTAPHRGIPDPNPQPPTDCEDAAKPAPRHATAFDEEPFPTPPSFNEGDVSDKPPSIRDLPALDATDVAKLAQRRECRLESLLSVDEGVEEIVGALQAVGELDETLVIYTSDNGFFLGEHRIPGGKIRHYEESSRVPLIIRGPGVPAGATEGTPAVNADWTATILDAANVAPGLPADGVSLLPIAADEVAELEREILIESQEYSAIRTNRYVYVEHTSGEDAGHEELYDLQEDPYQEDSVHADPAYDEIEASLRDRLSELATCAGASCRRIETAPGPGPAPVPEPGGATPPSDVESPPAEGSPTKLVLAGRDTQPLGRVVKVRAVCEEACEVEAAGDVVVRFRAGGGAAVPRAAAKARYRLRRASESLVAGERKTLELVLSKKKLRKVRRAMKSPRAKAKAKLEVVASGPAGGTDSATRTVKLRQ